MHEMQALSVFVDISPVYVEAIIKSSCPIKQVKKGFLQRIFWFHVEHPGLKRKFETILPLRSSRSWLKRPGVVTELKENHYDR